MKKKRTENSPSEHEKELLRFNMTVNDAVKYLYETFGISVTPPTMRKMCTTSRIGIRIGGGIGGKYGRWKISKQKLHDLIEAEQKAIKEVSKEFPNNIKVTVPMPKKRGVYKRASEVKRTRGSQMHKYGYGAPKKYKKGINK